MKDPKHLFIIGHDAWTAMGADDIAATITGLKECALYHLPYDRVTVRALMDDACSLATEPSDREKWKRHFGFYQDANGSWRTKMGPAYQIEFRNVNLLGEPMEAWAIHNGAGFGFKPYEFRIDNDWDFKKIDSSFSSIADGLIALLAVKNACKTTKHNKLAKLGFGANKIGSTKRFDYVTTISVPAVLEDDADHPPTGGTRAAHLRRGHVRRQHYGPRNEMVKLKWIWPMFVNADADFVNRRQAYNVSL